MKVNHAMVRDILKFIGITIFVISVALKLKEIFIYGGTRTVQAPDDGTQDKTIVAESDDDGDDDDRDDDDGYEEGEETPVPEVEA